MQRPGHCSARHKMPQVHGDRGSALSVQSGHGAATERGGDTGTELSAHHPWFLSNEIP